MSKQAASGTTREKLLTQAVKLFLKKGYEKTSTRDIAKAVGIQAPGIYYYFKSKKDILSELNEEGWDRFRRLILDKAKELDDPEARIELYIRNMIKYEFEIGERNLILDDSISIKNAKNRKSYEKLVFQFLRDTLRELAEKRGIKNAIDPGVAAFSLYPMIAGVHRWYKPNGRIKIEDLSEQIIQLFMEGFVGIRANQVMRDERKAKRRENGRSNTNSSR